MRKMEFIDDIQKCIPQIDAENGKYQLPEVGITSLQLMRLQNRWKKKGYNVKFKDLANSKTIDDWFSLLNSEQKINFNYELPEHENKEIFQLTDVQYAYWTGRDSEQAMGGRACHAYFEFDCEADISIERLGKAWIKVVNYHPMLRACFQKDGKFCILDNTKNTIKIHDLSTYSSNEAENHFLKLRKELSHKKLDIEHGIGAALEIIELPDSKKMVIDIDMLVADMQSLQIIFRDLVNAYKFPEKYAERFDMLFLEYLEQEKTIKNNEYIESKKFWNSRLRELPKNPELPLAKDPSKIVNPIFERKSRIIDKNTWMLLADKARHSEATLAMILLTAYVEVVSYWSSEKEFLINIPIFNRITNVNNIEDAVADFTNLLLLPVSINETHSFSEHLRLISQTFQKYIQYTAYSGVEVQREMTKLYPNSRFFAPVVFSYNVGEAMISETFEESIGHLSYMITQTPQVWLDNQTIELNEGILIAWDYVAELFPGKIIEDMFGCYINVLEKLSVADNWDKQFVMLPSHQLKIRKDLESKMEIEDENLFSSFMRMAYTEQERIAVIEGGTGAKITYWGLYNKAKKIAGLLKLNKISSGDSVAICIEKGIEQIATVLGVSFLGAKFVPISAQQPIERRRRIVETALIKNVITSQRYVDVLEWPDGMTIINVNDADKYSSELPVFPVKKEDLAYIIFTSGSTGTPKGVEITHGQALNTITAINKMWGISKKDKALAVSEFDFDLSIYDLFGLLQVGGTIVTIDDKDRKEPAVWSRYIKEYSITVFNSAPMLMEMLCEYAISHKLTYDSMKVFLSGDWITPTLISHINAVVINGLIIAMGGATEGAIWSNYFIVSKEVPHEWVSIPYGSPLPNQKYRVVNESGHDCPNWVIGELWIGGDGVATGYVNDEKLTNKKFIMNGTSRWYRTGDLGRFWDNGLIEFLGRKDNQVKIHGHRIELGEIENAIKEMPQVNDCIVTAVSDAAKNKQLAAYVIWNKIKADNLMNVNALVSIGCADDGIVQSNKRVERFLADYSCIFIMKVIDSLGGYSEKNARFSTYEMLVKSGISDDYEYLMDKWLELLVENKYLVKSGNMFENTVDFGDVVGRWENNDLWNEYKEYLYQFYSIALELLTNKENVSNIIGNAKYLGPEELIERLPYYSFLEEQMPVIFSKLFEKSGRENRPIQILEIGSRNIKRTQAIHRSLKAFDFNYKYTYMDASLFYLNRMKDNLEGQCSYLNEDIGDNECANMEMWHQFDVIIAQDILHTMKNLPLVIDNIIKLLKPTGTVVAFEVTRDHPVINISTGIIEKGFCDICNIRHTVSPLLSVNGWKKYFKDAGMKMAFCLYDDKDKIFCENILLFQNEWVIDELSKMEMDLILEERLPEYMIPSYYIAMNSFPLNQNGKIDRKSFPVPAVTNEEEFIEPATEVEIKLGEIWKSVLQVERISKNDNYFELGGDSLLANRLSTKIYEVFHIEMKIADIYKLSNFQKQCQFIEGKKVKQVQENPHDIKICPDVANWNEPFPLTEVQQAYWLGREGGFELGKVSTHCYFEMKCSDIDVRRIKESWNIMIKSHDMMRAVVLPDGEHQVVMENVPEYSIEVRNLQNRSEKEKISILENVRNEKSQQQFNPHKWPLFDVSVTVLNADEIFIHVSFDNIIFDGWSMLYILSEWKKVYENYSDIYVPKLRFRDYVVALEQLKTTEKYEQDKMYWREKLSAIKPAPMLPVKSAPTSIKNQSFRRKKYQLSSGKWKRFKKLAKESEITPATAILSAYVAILSRWSASDSFTINLTCFNRMLLHEDVMRLVGDFTSLILLTVNVDNDSSFVNHCSAIQKELWEDLEHISVGGVWVERELNKANSGKNQVMMPVVFTSGLGFNTNTDGGPDTFLGEIVEGLSQTPQTWLDHQIMEQNGTVLLTWDYVVELFPDGMIDEMFDTYVHLIDLLCEAKEKWDLTVGSLLQIPICKNILTANKTQNFISNTSMMDMIIQNLRSLRNKEAVIADNGTLSYSELNCLSANITKYIHDQGIKKGSIIAIVMEKGWEQIVAVLGVINAGCAYVPVDPQNPRIRVENILDNANISLILKQSWIDRFIELDISKYRVMDVDTYTYQNDIEISDFACMSTDLMYLIYTSGTTGIPKGVMINHMNAENTILDINHKFSVTETDKILAISNLNFDLSVYDIFGMLACGGTIVIPNYEKKNDPVYLIEILQKYHITICNIVPAYMELINDYLEIKEQLLASSVRLVLLSGDWIATTLPNRIKKNLAATTIVGLGGATECSIWSNYYVIEEVEQDWKSIPYGKPLSNQQFYIFDDNFNVTPCWVPGKLFIGGKGVAQGYYGDTERTKEKFVSHPITGERIYDTGDLGRYWSDGNIEFLGREDFQVKIHGHRIELGEIESILYQFDQIKNAVVLLDKENQQLYAAVTVKVAIDDFDEEQKILHFLSEHLPQYALPEKVFFFDELPLSNNGKIDRTEIMNIIKADVKYESIERKEPLLTETEILIGEVWKDVLGVSTVFRDDDFFKCGGDSLKGNVLMGKLESNGILKKHLSLRTLLVASTIRTLSEKVDEENSSQDEYEEEII